jgi:hypothetical protein
MITMNHQQQNFFMRRFIFEKIWFKNVDIGVLP